MNASVKRIQLDLPERALCRLQELKSKTEAASYAEVVRNALRLYEALITESESGGSFCVKDADGRLREYKVF